MKKKIGLFVILFVVSVLAAATLFACAPKELKNSGYGAGASAELFVYAEYDENRIIGLTQEGREYLQENDGVLRIPDGITAIGSDYGDALVNYGGDSGLLKSIDLNGVQRIGRCALLYADALESLTIPASVVQIGERAFSVVGLTSITVASGNTVYRSEQNCLIEKATDRLILACKNSVIPNTVKIIGSHSFRGLECGFSSLTIPNSVTKIESWAFSTCMDLVKIYIPASVTVVENDAFVNGLEWDSFPTPCEFFIAAAEKPEGWNDYWYSGPGSGQWVINWGWYVPSTNAFLSDLSIGTYALSPSFSSSQPNYTARVGNDVTSVAVTAVTDDQNATFAVSGNTSLAVGANTITVTVTAEDGETTMVYTIAVTRVEEGVDPNDTIEDARQALQDEIDRAKALIEDDYTAESWLDADLENEIAEAQGRLDDEDATIQALRDAKDKLTAAIDSLNRKDDGSGNEDGSAGGGDGNDPSGKSKNWWWLIPVGVGTAGGNTVLGIVLKKRKKLRQ